MMRPTGRRVDQRGVMLAWSEGRGAQALHASSAPPLAMSSSRLNESREGVGIVTRASIGRRDPIELSGSAEEAGVVMGLVAATW